MNGFVVAIGFLAVVIVVSAVCEAVKRCAVALERLADNAEEAGRDH